MSKYALVDNLQVIQYIIAGYVPGSSYSPPSGLNIYLIDSAALIGDGWDNDLQTLTPLDPPLELTTEERLDASVVAHEVALIGLAYLLAGKSATGHGHAISDVTGLSDALAAKQASISPAAHIADAATDAPTNAPTSLSLLTLLTATSEVNATNTKQNAIATKLNDLASKVNTLFDHLEAQSLQSAS